VIDDAPVRSRLATRILELFGSFGIDLREPADLSTLQASAALADDAVPSLEWLLRFLAHEGVVAMSGGRYRLERPPAPATAIEGPASELWSWLDHFLELYPRFWRRELSGVAAVVFEAPEHWRRGMRSPAVSGEAGALLGRACAQVAAARATPMRVLEIGCGTGAGTESVLSAMGRAPARFTLSDIGRSFTRDCRHICAELVPDWNVDDRLLDLARPWSPQGVEPASFDLVFALDALHVVRDVPQALREIRGALAPGGTLVAVEHVRPAPRVPVLIELPIVMLKDYWSSSSSAFQEGRYGFRTRDEWLSLAGAAGFAAVDAVSSSTGDVVAIIAQSR
jgi:SAM-dependent methyltransferase